MSTMRLTDKQRQWLWFVGLVVGGMAAMLIFAGSVRLMPSAIISTVNSAMTAKTIRGKVAG